MVASGGMNCPKEEHIVCYKHCSECRFHKSGGVTIETCTYLAAKNKWKKLNMFFFATPVTAEFLRKTLNISEMSDDSLKDRYKFTRQRLKEVHTNKEAYRINSETLFVLAGEIEKRNLF
jgi:hypothetical protein